MTRSVSVCVCVCVCVVGAGEKRWFVLAWGCELGLLLARGYRSDCNRQQLPTAIPIRMLASKSKSPSTGCEGNSLRAKAMHRMPAGKQMKQQADVWHKYIHTCIESTPLWNLTWTQKRMQHILQFLRAREKLITAWNILDLYSLDLSHHTKFGNYSSHKLSNLISERMTRLGCWFWSRISMPFSFKK